LKGIEVGEMVKTQQVPIKKAAVTTAASVISW
jgi:hypothetical protein